MLIFETKRREMELNYAKVGFQDFNGYNLLIAIFPATKISLFPPSGIKVFAAIRFDFEYSN